MTWAALQFALILICSAAVGTVLSASLYLAIRFSVVSVVVVVSATVSVVVVVVSACATAGNKSNGVTINELSISFNLFIVLFAHNFTLISLMFSLT